MWEAVQNKACFLHNWIPFIAMFLFTCPRLGDHSVYKASSESIEPEDSAVLKDSNDINHGDTPAPVPGVEFQQGKYIPKPSQLRELLQHKGPK